VEIRNHTPFALAPLLGRVRYPACTATLVVKAGFRLAPDGICEPLESQPALVGDVLSEADAPECLYDADLALFKPRADLLLSGTCHTPGGTAVTTCLVSLRVGSWSKTIAAIGNRSWKKGMVFSKPGEPQPFTRIPLRWSNAYGGPGFADNPAGTGFKEGLMPNLEYPDRLVTKPSQKVEPAGFGPVHRTWKQRTQRMGTYDKKWLKERWPAFPADFDWTHFNAAPADQQLEGYLRGDEEIELTNLHPEHTKLKTRLPGLRVRVLVREGPIPNGDSHQPSTINHQLHVREVPMNLDTLFVDADKGEVVLLWRGLADVADDEWTTGRDILIVSEPLEAAPRTLQELLPLFEEPGEEAEPEEAEDAEPPQNPETALAAFHAEIAEAEKQAEQQQQQALSPAYAGLSHHRDVKAAIAAAPKNNLNDALAAFDRAIAEAASRNIKGLEAIGPLVKSSLNDPDVTEALKALNAPAAQAPQGKSAVAALLRSGEASEGDFAGAELAGEDLSGLDMRGCNLNGANLEGANLENAQLPGASLVGANLRGAKLVAADLGDADLTGADLSYADLTGAILKEAMLDHAVATGANFTGAHAAGAVFSEFQGEKSCFAGADLSEALFVQARLKEADFSQAMLSDASFEGARAEVANFTGASMVGARCGEAAWAGAKFIGTKAAGSVWENARLNGADFGEADLKGALFPGADLSGARLFGADFTGATFRGAKLAGAQAGNANFFQCLLEKADLSDGSFVESNFFEAEFLNAQTKGADFAGANLKMTKLAAP
jgi:uncharacterized protein YjbI with pentapeptide repeats